MGELRYTEALVCCTGLGIGGSPSSKPCRLLRTTRALTIIFLVGAYLVTGLVTSFFNGAGPVTTRLLFWVVRGRGFMSMVFLVYWQLSGGFTLINTHLNHPSLSALVDRKRLRKLDFCVAVYVAVLSISQVLMDSFALFFDHPDEAKHVRDVYDDPFGTPYGRMFCTYLLMSYQVLAGNTTFAVLSLTLLSLKLRFDKQHMLLRALGKDGPSDQSMVGAENIMADLDARMECHFKLLKSVATVSRVYETYIFLHTLLLVPRFINSSWHVQEVSRDVTAALTAAHSTLKSVTAFSVIVLLPANLHATIQGLHSSVWGNELLWLPHCAELHFSARTLLASTHSSVGISLGGFTVITSSLMVTLVSATVSFITLFNEVSQTPFTESTNTTTF